MSERDELLAAIISEPQDDVVRLVFADWLEEHDEAERAEFIRLQIAHSQIPDSIEREAELLSTYGPVWRHAESSIVNDGAFERGFIEWLEISEYGWWRQLEAKSAFFTESPGRSVRIRNANLSWDQPGEPDPRTIPIRRLVFDSCEIDDDAMLWLVTQSLPNLVELRLANNFIDDEGLRRLAASTNMPQLRVLDLTGNVFSNDGLADLLRSEFAAKLDSLILENNENLTAAIVPIIAHAPAVIHLSQLKLAGTSIPPTDQHRLMNLATGHAPQPMSPPPVPVIPGDELLPIRDDNPIPDRTRFGVLLLRWVILGAILAILLAIGSLGSLTREFTLGFFQISNVAAMTTIAGILVLSCHRFLIPFARRIGAVIYPLIIGIFALIAWSIDPTVMMSMLLAVFMGSIFGVRTVTNNIRLLENENGYFRYRSQSTSFGIPLTATIIA